IPAPYWVSYPDIVKLAGGRPVIVETTVENGFCLSPDELRRAITPRTRAFILNSPSNPTGGAYGRAELDRLRAVLEDHPEIVVVTDDIYRRLVYGGFQFHHIASLSKTMAERTILVDGMSKTYSMTGWRVGYTVGPKQVVAAMAT